MTNLAAIEEVLNQNLTSDLHQKNLISSSNDVLMTTSKTNTFSGSSEKRKINGGISKSKKEAHLFEKVSEFLIEAFRSD